MNSYYFGEACQNTFILFDKLEISCLEEDFLKLAHQNLLEENKDDALILYHGTTKGDDYYARMAVVGHDGMIAEFCGNGARVCAAYLFAQFPHQTFGLVTLQGTHTLHKQGNLYSIVLPMPKFAMNPKFITDSKLIDHLGLIFVDMLEPHLTIEAKLSDEELFSLGRHLNKNKTLFPYGINVNAWHILEEGHLFVKTYERGVQRLTHSCGTGSLSCAALYNRESVQITTPGGPLKVHKKNGFELVGPASIAKKVLL